MSKEIQIPKPKPLKVKWSELDKLASRLGLIQDARVDGWDVTSVMSEIAERGYDEDAGATPCIEEGADHFLDGNRRATACLRLAKAKPDLYGDKKIEVNVYPKLNPDQRQELINRAARSTLGFTVWDWYKQSMNRWLARPDEDQLEHLKGMGVERARIFFPSCVPDVALKVDPVTNKPIPELKDGVRADDVWGKGKGGNKQGPVQVGKALSRAHPRVREAFFAARTDPEHSVTYREVIEMNSAWETDQKMRPDLAVPPAPFEVLAEKFPESKLVAALGPRLLKGKNLGGGRGEGGGRMSKKDVEGLMVSLNFSQLAAIDYHRAERDPGYVGDEPMRDQEAVHRFVQRCLDGKFSSIEEFKASQEQAKAIIDRTFARAAAAAAANAAAAAAKK